MIINPTKKSLPLFSALPKVADSQASKAFSTANPFFSWHANYYNVNRKKVLVLVNDLTMMPIVIADVNAQSKKQLAQMITEGIWCAFRWAGIANEQIQQYLDIVGEIEVNAGFNRQVTGVTTMYIQMAEHSKKFVSNERIQAKLMVWLAESGTNSLSDYYPKKALVKAIEQNLKLNPVEKEYNSQTKKEKTTLAGPIEVTWQDFSKWEDYTYRLGHFAGYKKVAKEIRANNELVLQAFENYLKENLGLGDNIIKRHVGEVRFFMNEYLLHDGIQIISDDSYEPCNYIENFYPHKSISPTVTEVRNIGAALKKFYEFLAKAKVLSKEDLSYVKDDITESVDVAIKKIKSGNSQDFWW